MMNIVRYEELYQLVDSWELPRTQAECKNVRIAIDSYGDIDDIVTEYDIPHDRINISPTIDGDLTVVVVFRPFYTYATNPPRLIWGY